MKKVICTIILITFTVLALHDCDKIINTDKVERETCEEVLKYLENGDNETLKKCFVIKH